MKLLYLVFLLLTISCAPSFDSTESDRLYLKHIKLNNGYLSWFTYSSSYANSPDFITISNKENVDTLCISDNIIQVIAEDSIIKVKFDGPPSLYTKKIYVKNKLMNYIISIDTIHDTTTNNKGFLKNPDPIP